MIKIEVKSGTVTERRFPSKREPGKTVLFREQEAWAFLFSVSGPHPYPSRIVLPLEPDQAAYPPGIYSVNDASVYVGDFGALRLGRLILQPVAAAAQRAA